MKNQYQEQKKKLSKKEQKQQEKDIKSWKELGGYEAIQDAINGGKITEQEIRDRNERMSNKAHKTINTTNKPIDRGIEVDNDVASIIVDRFEIGEMVEIPDEKGHGSSGFSIGSEEKDFSQELIMNIQKHQFYLEYYQTQKDKLEVCMLMLKKVVDIKVKKKLFVVLNQMKLFQ